MRRMMSDSDQKQIIDSIAQLTQDLTSLEDFISTKLDVIFDNIDNLNELIDETTDATDELKEEVSTLNVVAAGLSTKVKSLNNAQQVLSTEITTINNKVKELDNKVNNLKPTSMAQDVGTLKYQLKKKEAQLRKRQRKTWEVVRQTAVGEVVYKYHT